MRRFEIYTYAKPDAIRIEGIIASSVRCETLGGEQLHVVYEIGETNALRVACRQRANRNRRALEAAR